MPTGPRPATFRVTDADGRLEGPFNAMLLNPVVGHGIQELGDAVRNGTNLTARQREIAVLTVAALHRSEYEWYAHERLGLAIGLTQDEIDTIRMDQSVPTFSDDEAMVYAITARLVKEQDIEDELYASAVEILGIETLSDVVVLTGYREMLSLVLRVWRAPLPEGISPAFAGDHE
ncbi:carboxymuconolactone decarboxylase family protein [Nocardia sp. R6R-6]|uniref:carboxymuconolactone decarboxylase family protein n=1 Tax=Nocardia sp. R6R-6 TaxID=3459303 RepID=UPI00403E169D